MLTYVLLIVKALLFGYMLLAEKSLVSDWFLVFKYLNIYMLKN